MDIAQHILQMACTSLGGVSTALAVFGLWSYLEDYREDGKKPSRTDVVHVGAFLLIGVALLTGGWFL